MSKKRHVQRKGGDPPGPRSTGPGGFVTQFEQQEITYDSILPPAFELERMEAIRPGTTEWFMRMAEEEVVDRRAKADRMIELQSRSLWFNGVSSILGVLFGGTIGILAVGGGVYAMLQGTVADLAGAGVALGGLASLVGVFIYGRRASIEQRRQKETS